MADYLRYFADVFEGDVELGVFDYFFQKHFDIVLSNFDIEIADYKLKYLNKGYSLQTVDDMVETNVRDHYIRTIWPYQRNLLGYLIMVCNKQTLALDGYIFQRLFEGESREKAFTGVMAILTVYFNTEIWPELKNYLKKPAIICTRVLGTKKVREKLKLKSKS